MKPGLLYSSILWRNSSSSSTTPTRGGHRIASQAQAVTKPQTRDRGPPSEETTQTDFAALDVLGSIPGPATAVDACLDDGFHLDNGVKITEGDGVLLVGGEAFAWRPWHSMTGDRESARKQMVNEKGQFEVPEEVWGLLSVVWPRPGTFSSRSYCDSFVVMVQLTFPFPLDILILGLGASVFPLSPKTKKHINSLGMRVDVQDTRNASAQFNLLATERGATEVAAAMIPIGWKGR